MPSPHSKLRVVHTVTTEVRHRLVRPTGHIRFGRHLASVGIQTHADDIGRHHPRVSVDEGAAEPVVHHLRRVSALESPVAQHHQANDVVGVAQIPYVPKGVPQARSIHFFHRCLKKPGRWLNSVVELITEFVGLPKMPIQVPDIFPPSDDLTDKSLDTGQGRLVHPPSFFSPSHYLGRMEQPEVQRHG